MYSTTGKLKIYDQTPYRHAMQLRAGQTPVMSGSMSPYHFSRRHTSLRARLRALLRQLFD